MQVNGKLKNAEGELIAEGPCEVSEERREVTMWPVQEMHMLQRQRGTLTLELESGRTLELSDCHMTFRVALPGQERRSVYRLRLLEQQQLPLTAGVNGGVPQALP